ncbi:sulfotransferase family protein [Pedococcus sp. 2YAF34]|uniref:sulfotransferase family protein n=1 Tax=Pedococcus sp. 2YAF34 TaxID=3233032 RepID=UPI003F98457D
MTGTPTPHADQAWLPYYVGKVRRHLHWARTEGIGRLVEEDRLDPRERIGTALRKARWRRAHGVPPGAARPVYVVGLQRSGTNMIMRGVDQAPEVDVCNENDRRAFSRFRLRPDETLVSVVRSSRHRIVLVKPLCESHRVDQLLALPGLPAGRAVWVVRDPEDRARSEVSKFGDSNLQALRQVAAGHGDDIWQGQRLLRASVDLVRSFDLETMTRETAAVLFWVVRNQLWFDLGLDRRPDVMLVSYDRFVADPHGQMRRLCAFIDLPYRPVLCSHVTPRTSHGSAALPIDPDVRRLARGLLARLDEAAARARGTAATQAPVPAGGEG